RNFAHGRHNWLGKRGASTAVLALVSDDDRDIAEKTMRLIPSEIPCLKIDIARSGPSASLAALIAALHIVGIAGEIYQVDPGRPGVARFGRAIYNLRAFSIGSKNVDQDSKLESIAIERKLGDSIERLALRPEFESWRKGYHIFIQGLRQTSFNGIV